MTENLHQEKLMEYRATNGDPVRLTMNMVKKYLVSGRPELVTEQEIFYFMHICKARKLNPFVKDCYLIKYTQNDPAAIITSVDYFRKNARKHEDCKGWSCGVITKDQNGSIRYSKGLVLDGEEVVGGWFKAQPDGWNEPFELEVPLDPYIKKTKEGKPTSFWSSEKQSTMIRKVAESQGLRELWGEESSAMYTPEEMVNPEVITAVQQGVIQDDPKSSGLYEPTKQPPKFEHKEPGPDAPNEPEPEQQEYDNPWNPASWKDKRKTGLANLVRDHHGTFDQQSLSVKAAFREKWSRVMDTPYPLDPVEPPEGEEPPEATEPLPEKESPPDSVLVDHGHGIPMTKKEHLIGKVNSLFLTKLKTADEMEICEWITYELNKKTAITSVGVLDESELAYVVERLERI